MPPSLPKKLFARELTGQFRFRKQDALWKPFSKIPGRMCYRLKYLVPPNVLEEGYVFLGFSKSGQFVLSYSLQIDTDEHTAYPDHIYRLQWWHFIPCKRLQLISEVPLFGEENIFHSLFIAFCEWPEDNTKVTIYGHSTPPAGDDGCQCYLTVTAVPSLGGCHDCQMRTHVVASVPSIQQCFRHSFCVHSKFELAPPFPFFSPRVQLRVDGIVILNTGDSISKSTRSSCDRARSSMCEKCCGSSYGPVNGNVGGANTNNMGVPRPGSLCGCSTLSSHRPALRAKNLCNSNTANSNESPSLTPASTDVEDSISIRQSSQRSFFSPSSSAASDCPSQSSESVIVHTTHTRTVTFSVRRFSTQDQQVEEEESPVTAEDDYDLAYKSILPVQVVWNKKPLNIIRTVRSDMSLVTVLQMTFDIEHYMAEAIHHDADWGPRYVAFCNYDLQILDVCPSSQNVYGTVYALIQAKESAETSRFSRMMVKLYQTQLFFVFNLCTGLYSTLFIAPLSEVDERILRARGDWNSPGNKECCMLRRKSAIPQSFFNSVHVLSNESVFREKSLSMLIAPYMYTAIML
ncbi:hypothetical protein EGW08_003671 [Elysia chlorotica]|uniref:DDB1- and CUL4-associated factor 15 WD40 repeat-containing domain-containing protein n=1 Tax=Elysia chlorotica TaxID=188477 RepID=A0A3S0ZXR1_ELYCH|nr:hypothetical protein EGW08_003671 [Elysia chlorotica]